MLSPIKLALAAALIAAVTLPVLSATSHAGPKDANWPIRTTTGGK